VGRDEGHFMGNVRKRVLKKEEVTGRIREGVTGRLGDWETSGRVKPVWVPLPGGARGGFIPQSSPTGRG
jgi:hypothetical protein